MDKLLTTIVEKLENQQDKFKNAKNKGTPAADDLYLEAGYLIKQPFPNRSYLTSHITYHLKGESPQKRWGKHSPSSLQNS